MAAERRPAVLGTGLLALDVIVSASPASEPVFAAGGTCGNVLTALSYFGWDAYPIARLNGDPASKLVQQDLEQWNVRLEFVGQAPNARTPIIVQQNRHDATHRFSMACPECGTWFPSFRPVTQEGIRDLVERLLDRCSSIPEPQVFFFDRVSRGALMLAEASTERGALVVFEPSSVGDPKLFSEALARTHILKYSRDRLPELSKRPIHPDGPVIEIETLGAEGLRYRTRERSGDGWHYLPAIPAPTVADTAGAGDWCIAGLLARLGQTSAPGLTEVTPTALRDAFRFGQAAATLACVYEGARGVMYALDPSEFTTAMEAILDDSGAGVLNGRIPAARPQSTFRSSLGHVCPGCEGTTGESKRETLLRYKALRVAPNR